MRGLSVAFTQLSASFQQVELRDTNIGTARRHVRQAPGTASALGQIHSQAVAISALLRASRLATAKLSHRAITQSTNVELSVVYPKRTERM